MNKDAIDDLLSSLNEAADFFADVSIILQDNDAIASVEFCNAFNDACAALERMQNSLQKLPETAR
ncbi:MAG: hypothetical protein ACHQU0_03840 [Candidatus Paceibacteria bacterium]